MRAWNVVKDRNRLYLNYLHYLVHRLLNLNLAEYCLKFSKIEVTALVIGMVNFQTQITGPTIMNLEGILYNTVRDMNFIFLFPSINVSFLSLSKFNQYFYCCYC